MGESCGGICKQSYIVFKSNLDFFEGNKNFYIKEGAAYTEDEVLVYNIFVYKIPRKFTEKEVFDYFSSYGEVRKVRLIADKKQSRRSAPKVGSVHFSDYRVATEVLLKAHHYLKSIRIYVKACDSWHQPAGTVQDITAFHTLKGQADDNCDDRNSIDGIVETFNMLTVLHLNDDCLEHICKQLKFRDQVNFARTCKRFSGVFQLYCKLEHKTFELNKLESFTLWEIRDFLRLAGANIKALTGSVSWKNQGRIVEFLSRECQQVQRINLYSSTLKSASLRKLLGALTFITDLQLHDCSLKDSSLLVIKTLPKLQILHLSENYELTGKHLNKLKNLNELNLYGCENIQSTFVISMLESLKDLRVLNIQRCDRLNTAVFTAISSQCTNLEVLKMSCTSASYECVAQLPSLKHLEITMLSKIVPLRNQFFVALTNHKANQLEYLAVIAKNCITKQQVIEISRLKHLKTLICPDNKELNDLCLRMFGDLENLEWLVINNCRAITNDGLLYLLSKCTKLQRLSLQNCSNITDTFVFKAINVLKNIHKKEQSRRKEPMLISVAKSGINEFIVNSPQYAEAKPFLKLSFTVPFGARYDQDQIDLLSFLDEDDDFDSDEYDFIDDDNDFIGDLDDDDEDDFYGYDLYNDYSDGDDGLHQAYHIFGNYHAAFF